jgi:hypothetical protein
MWRAISGSSPRGFVATAGAGVGASGLARVVATAGREEAERGSTRLTGMAGRTVCGETCGAGGGEAGLAGVGVVRLGEGLGEEDGGLVAGIGLATQATLKLPRPPLLPLLLLPLPRSPLRSPPLPVPLPRSLPLPRSSLRSLPPLLPVLSCFPVGGLASSARGAASTGEYPAPAAAGPASATKCPVPAATGPAARIPGTTVAAHAAPALTTKLLLTVTSTTRTRAKGLNPPSTSPVRISDRGLTRGQHSLTHASRLS